MIKAKAARRIRGEEEGQLFVQCTKQAEHIALLDAWRATKGQAPAERPPCPLPEGHMMFSRPEDYNCRPATIAQVGGVLCVAE